MDIHLKETIPKVFQPIHKAVQNEGIQEVVAKGGRGSGKSSYLSLELVLQLLRHPDCHAVVLRKVAGTLRNSVYNQVVWAIDALGCVRPAFAAQFHRWNVLICLPDRRSSFLAWMMPAS